MSDESENRAQTGPVEGAEDPPSESSQGGSIDHGSLEAMEDDIGDDTMEGRTGDDPMADQEYVDPEESAGEQGRDTPEASMPDAVLAAPSRSRRAWMLPIALVVVIVAAAVAIVAILQSTVPNGDLEAAEADLAEAQREAADDARSAAEAAAAAAAAAGVADERIAELESEIDGFMRTVSDLQGDIADRERVLSDARSESDMITADLDAALEEIDEAATTLAGTTEIMQTLATIDGLYIAWVTWVSVSEEFFERAGDIGIDLGPIDEIVTKHGLADSWETWSATEFFAATRVMDNFLDDLDDPALTDAFDAWAACEGDEECAVAGIALESRIFTLEREALEDLADLLGSSLTAAL